MFFRPVEKKDLTIVLALIKELATHERRPDAVVASVQDLESILFSPHPIGYGLVAERDGHIVGYALLAIKFSSFRGKPVLYIEDVYIQQKARGKGAGFSFMQEISRFAQHKNCIAMEWSALDFNEIAITFYEKMGAELETGRVHFDGDSEFIKRISDA
ncbi:GNAT family N-acetyltransferase [Temperatibacter marinus]|uniref:GNAT family N-acetyltransferase n=1 Tax=Temperatibacter marinus TaxID=1456591 RepID=A0AA52EI60_9PROT|nr:GNAT family N-acetyltransferase [Temperatibacter marinus]WND02759.1 GNAT family N-acetyltransferase [Temperatibacter marinus]